MNFSTLRASGSGNGLVYLDHNATTPLASRVAEKVPLWLAMWGNPSSIHQVGRLPKTLLREAREKVASMIGCQPLEVVFTSGGSEANNLALKGVFDAFQKPGLIPCPFRNRYLISRVEHPSVVRTAQYLQQRGAEVDFIPVLRSGAIDLDAYRALVDEKTALVSVMVANNETGNIFPIAELVKIAHSKGALFHSDCVQALGKIPLNVGDLGVDFATFSGHKFYSLKGCGVLYQRRGLNLESLVHGGGQERHRRGGTENILAIAALGLMCEMKLEVAPRAAALELMRDRMEKRILSEIPQVVINGADIPRLSNTSSLIVNGVDGETLLMNLDLHGFAVSTGAACSSGSSEPSPVLLGMGLTRAEAQSSLRLGLGWDTTQENIDRFIIELKSVVTHLRSFNRLERESHVSL